MTQRGSALIYILVAIALLGALTMSFVEPSGQQSRSQNSFKLATQLKSQADAYKAAIEDCVLTYPAGDTSNATKYAGYNEPYPLTTNSTYLPSGLRDATYSAKSIRCPGNPGNSNNHVSIFGGSSGLFAPPPPPLMQNWTYFNTADGVFIVTGTNKTDQYLIDAMNKTAAMYNSCEAQSVAGPGGPSSLCLSGYSCLFVWVKRNTACP